MRHHRGPRQRSEGARRSLRVGDRVAPPPMDHSQRTRGPTLQDKGRKDGPDTRREGRPYNWPGSAPQSSALGGHRRERHTPCLLRRSRVVCKSGASRPSQAGPGPAGSAKQKPAPPQKTCCQPCRCYAQIRALRGEARPNLRQPSFRPFSSTLGRTSPEQASQEYPGRAARDRRNAE